MLEDFINAFKNFKSNKTRTFLSLLGVIIGVASVIVITSMGSSSTKQIENTFGSAGLDVVSISAGFMSRRGSTTSVTFDEAARTDLFDNIIILCGGTYYDCYRMLRDDAGILRKQMEAEDMLSMLNVDKNDEDNILQPKKKIRNRSNILNILSAI